MISTFAIFETKVPSNPEPKIIWKKGKKYTVSYPSGIISLACLFEGCESRKTEEFYCNLHKSDPINPIIPKIEDVIKTMTNPEIKTQEIPEMKVNSKSEQKIIWKNGKKYKIYRSGLSRLVCLFNGCCSDKKIGSYCNLHRNGIINIKTEEEKKAIREKAKLSAETGDATEIFVEEIIGNMEEIDEYERIGYTGDKIVDVKYKFKDEDFLRGVQVKTLYKAKGSKNKWLSKGRSECPDNTLFVLVNQDRDKFVLIFAKDYPMCGLGVTFSMTARRNKYKNNLYTDIDKFKEDLLLGMKNSVIYKASLSPSYIKEKESKLRLNKVCDDQKLYFNNSKKSGSIYDCIINNFYIQCKFTSRIGSDIESTYSFECTTEKISGCDENGKQLYVPYDKNDQIDFLAIEVSSLPGHFYIVPKEKLVLEGVFSSEISKGKNSIRVPTPDFKGTTKYKWLLDYYDRWDLLKSK
jgi:hypothetical protein